KALAPQGGNVTGIAGDFPWRHGELRVAQQMTLAGLFAADGFQALDAILRIALVKLTARNDTGGSAIATEGDHPVPDVGVLGMNGDTDLVAIELLTFADVVVNVGEKGCTGREVAGAIKAQHAGKNACKTTGIQYKAGTQLIGSALFILGAQHRKITAHVGAGDGVTPGHLYAFF